MQQPPILGADEPLESAAEKFFRYDCLQVQGMLPAGRCRFFRQMVERIFADDDARAEAGLISDESEQRQYTNGWIWETRFAQAAEGAFCFEDIVASRRLWAILTELCGKHWRPIEPSQLRRMSPRRKSSRFLGSETSPHIDAQWGVEEKFTINVWTPLTACGVDAPGLELLLAPAEIIREIGQYDSTIPMDPPGPGGISPRINYRAFERDVLRRTFDADRFWTPENNVGDVLLFSNWCLHSTAITERMSKTRISLEFRVAADSFDSPLRRPGGQ
jgi:hypothetical protein